MKLNFGLGLLVGSLAAGAYSLFTAKRSGADNQRAIADYLDDVSGASNDVAKATANLKQAVANVQREVAKTVPPAVADLQAEVTDFQFQADAHMKHLNSRLETVTTALNQTAANQG